MDEKQIKAQEVYQTLCDTLDARNWHYSKNEEKMSVSFGVNGDDLPMDFVIIVDANRQLVRLLSMLNFKFPEDKRVEGAIATTVASYGMVDGSFDFDLNDGSVIFRMTASSRESRLGQGLFAYLIDCACFTEDRYNEKFLAVSKGMMSIQDFIAQE